VGSLPSDAYGARTRDPRIDGVSLIIDDPALFPLS